jgi:hypothetical protein
VYGIIILKYGNVFGRRKSIFSSSYDANEKPFKLSHFISWLSKTIPESLI